MYQKARGLSVGRTRHSLVGQLPLKTVPPGQIVDDLGQFWVCFFLLAEPNGESSSAIGSIRSWRLGDPHPMPVRFDTVASAENAGDNLDPKGIFHSLEHPAGDIYRALATLGPANPAWIYSGLAMCLFAGTELLEKFLR